MTHAEIIPMLGTNVIPDPRLPGLDDGNCTCHLGTFSEISPPSLFCQGVELGSRYYHIVFCFGFRYCATCTYPNYRSLSALCDDNRMDS